MARWGETYEDSTSQFVQSETLEAITVASDIVRDVNETHIETIDSISSAYNDIINAKQATIDNQQSIIERQAKKIEELTTKFQQSVAVARVPSMDNMVAPISEEWYPAFTSTIDSVRHKASKATAVAVDEPINPIEALILFLQQENLLDLYLTADNIDIDDLVEMEILPSNYIRFGTTHDDDETKQGWGAVDDKWRVTCKNLNLDSFIGYAKYE